jgi:hypothetical protein
MTWYALAVTSDTVCVLGHEHSYDAMVQSVVEGFVVSDVEGIVTVVKNPRSIHMFVDGKERRVAHLVQKDPDQINLAIDSGHQDHQSDL